MDRHAYKVYKLAKIKIFLRSPNITTIATKLKFEMRDDVSDDSRLVTPTLCTAFNSLFFFQVLVVTIKAFFTYIMMI